jgi:N-acetylmuramoyl-L-alanine amidase
MVPTGARCAGACRWAAATSLIVAAWLVLAPPAIASPAGTKPDQAEELAGTHTRTRFVIGLDRPTEFQVFSLQNPNRVIVDLADVKVQLPSLPEGQQVGLVKSFRGGLAAPGKMRVVIDVTDPVVVETAQMEPAANGRPPRLRLDIVPFVPAPHRPRPGPWRA